MIVRKFKTNDINIVHPLFNYAKMYVLLYK